MAGLEGGFYRAFAMYFKFAGELDDENCVLAGKSHQHHQTDLNEDVVVTARKPKTPKRAAKMQTGTIRMTAREGPALVREQPEQRNTRKDRQWEDEQPQRRSDWSADTSDLSTPKPCREEALFWRSR